MKNPSNLNWEFHEETLAFSEIDLENFASVSGDFNPVHLDEEFAIAQGFAGRIVHGALMISKVSGIIATSFPGPGTIIGSIEWKFISPVLVGQNLDVKFALERLNDKKGLLGLKILNDFGDLLQEANIVLFFGK